MAQGTGSTVLRKVEETLLAGTDASLPTEERKLECSRRFTDLGLGRGVDATSNKPWLEKSSFQVRRVTFDSLLGTEEGGVVEAYEDEVGSVQSMQLGMRASVVAPTTSGPVKVGVEAELNRSITNTRHTVGQRVMNRTIAFKEEFDDTLFSTAEALKPSAHPEENWRFEERLMAWILENLQKDYSEFCPDDDLVEKLHEGTSPAALFKEWYKGCTTSQNKQAAQEALFSLCYDFVGHFRITHYVCCLRLGAVEYSVLSEQEFVRSMTHTTTAGVDMVKSSISAKYSSKKSSRAQRSKKIGAIVDVADGEVHVPRGTYAEAVVAVEFKPISTLVRHPHLRKALTESIAQCIETKGDATVGPFLIVAESRVGPLVYLSIDLGTMTLQATTSRRRAKPFIIITSEEKAYDFHIVHINVSGNSHRSSLSSLFSSQPSGYRPLPHYLTAHPNLLGYSAEPLQLEINPPVANTLFHLHSRLRTTHPPPEALGPWLSGKEAFFVSCSSRWFARDGYLAILKQGQRGGADRREGPGGGADRREGPGGGADHQEVRRGGADRRERQGGGADYGYTPVCIPLSAVTEDYYSIFRLVDSEHLDAIEANNTR